MKRTLSLVLLGIGCSIAALAWTNPTCPAPEIDPGSCTAALALLTGTVLVFRGRRKA